MFGVDVGNLIFGFVIGELFCAGWLFNIFWTQQWDKGGRPLAVGLGVLLAFLIALKILV